MSHWTEENADAFAHKLAFDFIAQIEEKIERLSLSQTELARRLGVTEGAVSKVLNNPQNLTLTTIVKYARALGVKPAIIAYDDDDPTNEKGLVSSGIFTTCWERAGKPHDVWSMDIQSHHSTKDVMVAPDFIVAPCQVRATSFFADTSFFSGLKLIPGPVPYVSFDHNPDIRSLQDGYYAASTFGGGSGAETHARS